jgi:hypothetical protein
LNGPFAKIKESSGNFENLGFTFSTNLNDEINRIQANICGTNIKTLVIGTDALASENIDTISSNSNSFWLRKAGEMGKSLVPAQDINQIANWLTISGI